MRVKLRAQAAGLSSVAFEGDQIVMRFPPLPEGITERNLPGLGRELRSGRNAYWMASGKEEWKTRLLDALVLIAEACQPA